MSTHRSSKIPKGQEKKEKDEKSVDDFLDKGFTVLEVGEVFKEAILLKVAGEFKRLFQSDAKHDKRYQNFIARDKDQLRFDFALSPRVQQKVLSLFPVRCVETIDRFAKKVLDEQDLKMQVRVFASLPGSRAQTWHRDAPRKKTFEAMNFFILLNEPDRDLGLTEIVPFSHLKGPWGVSSRGKMALCAPVA
jgi:ectoine hydroxylase-related dioxygenase (phytanoyl-CoA dioxygenase family)